MRRTKAEAAQSLAEIALLIMLLTILGGGVAILVGPGLDAAYERVADWADAILPRVALPTFGRPAAPTACAQLTLMGALESLDTDGDGLIDTLRFGGPANCSLVVATRTAGDPLTADASSVPARLYCAEIDALRVGAEYSEGGGAFAFHTVPAPAQLHIVDENDRPLLSATLTFGDLTVRPRRVDLSVQVSDLRVEDRIGSPTLAALQQAGAAQLTFELPAAEPWVGQETRAGKFRLLPRRERYSATLSAGCTP
jgi:hypothetical protein